MIDSLDALLDRLNTGDSTAAEEAFVACEPYLRKVVRRLLPVHLRTKFDSIDVVNSVCGDVMTAFRSGSTGVRFRSSVPSTTRYRPLHFAAATRVRANRPPPTSFGIACSNSARRSITTRCSCAGGVGAQAK